MVKIAQNEQLNLKFSRNGLMTSLTQVLAQQIVVRIRLPFNQEDLNTPMTAFNQLSIVRFKNVSNGPCALSESDNGNTLFPTQITRAVHVHKR